MIAVADGGSFKVIISSASAVYKMKVDGTSHAISRRKLNRQPDTQHLRTVPVQRGLVA
jgi:hypothetical protein